MEAEVSDHLYLMPSEWEQHEATWISWPANVTDWPGKFTPIPWVFSEIAKKITQGETLRIIVNSKEHEAKARRVLRKAEVNLERIEFFRFPTDRGWTRDSGPMFTRCISQRDIAIMRFRFNAWAKYPNWKKDDANPERASKALRIPIVHALHKGKSVVLEGGSIDVNGKGTLLTTEECLLHPTIQIRNPGFGRNDWESVFKEYLGASNVLWLNRGIAGDDTHGHVDDLCRFVNHNTVVLCSEGNSNDDNYVPLQENRERMEEMRLEDGSKVTVVPLPMPSPIFFDGQRLPASYANFYIANAAALVPTFNDVNDRKALGIISELITDRPVIGIYAVDLVWGLGTIHCLTQQQPA